MRIVCWQTILMKYHTLFLSKTRKDVGKFVVCCSRDGGRLDLAVPFTPFTPNMQNRNQVCWNICAGVRRSTPSSEVV